MSCQTCGGFEHFTAQEMVPPSSCVSKESMNKCMYTAQGMFMCNKQDLKEELGVAKNYWMQDNSKNTFGPIVAMEK
jgi:hypothetical protein